MHYKDIDELKEKNRVFFYFSEISKIPRPTFFEKEISDFIKIWAENLNLEAYQDSKNNLLIRKKASSGYENKEAVILQAHVDMVCEKSENSSHDFFKDPIDLMLDGDILSTGNKTTLGADDGIGVAIAMAILEDKTLKHPAIDVILTTAEEEDMSGALNLDPSWFKTNKIINIDHVSDNEIIVGSCGGKAVELKFKLEYKNISENLNFYKIKLFNLAGGHSGEDIDKGRSNAIVLLGRLLNKFRESFEFDILDIKGGNFRLAIPREAYILIGIERKNEEIFKKILSEFELYNKLTLSPSDKNLSILLEEVKDLNTSNSKSFSENFKHKIIDTIILSPNGILNMFESLNAVESSCNLGELYIKDDFIFFISEIRATFEENKKFIYEKIALLAKRFMGEIRTFYHYPSWLYKEKSNLQIKASDIYKDLYTKDVKILTVHAGLECSCFEEKIKNMDAISIGPNMWDLHSPKERVSISSVEKIYKFLTVLLENLN